MQERIFPFFTSLLAHKLRPTDCVGERSCPGLVAAAGSALAPTRPAQLLFGWALLQFPLEMMAILK